MIYSKSIQLDLQHCNMFEIIPFTNKQPFYTKLAFTVLLFLLVTLPRFNRHSLIVDRPLNDARYFKAYVEYFRGETPSDVIRPASNWRILVPILAALLPFEPLTSVNIVNCVCIALSLLFLFKSICYFAQNTAVAWFGCWLFIFSFPTFYYTAIGYIDPGVMLFVSLGIYVTITQQLWALILTFTIGALAKETIIVLLPFVLVYNWFINSKQALRWSILLFVLYMVINIILRQYAYTSPEANNPIFWTFSTQAIWLNAHRFNSYAAPLLSFGLPGLLFLWLNKKMGWLMIKHTPLFLASWAMLIGIVFVFGTTVVTTYCDGRIIWIAYYPLILASMVELDTRYKNR